jgi:IS5 family transposase
LISSGVEKQYISHAVERADAEARKAVCAGTRRRGLSNGARRLAQQQARQSLRCNLLRFWLGEDFRGLSRRLAEAPLFQWFCGVDRLGVVKVPTKSTLQRYSREVSAEMIRELVNTLAAAGAQPSSAPGSPQKLGLETPLDMSAYFVDTTCLKLNIHFPVDWVLLRDAARTLLKATILIRRRGLKNRMQKPRDFLREMNRRCIEMTQAARRKDGKKERKRILREMTALSHRIRRHAERHKALLSERWRETDLREGEVKQIVARIDGVLDQLPQAIKQARERLIRERQVPNSEKLLTLYEPHAEVLIRGKAAAKIEFGSQLFLGEQHEGVIVDWALLDGEVRTDAHLLPESLERLKKLPYFALMEVVAGDRGFATKDNSAVLKDEDLRDALCPKSPKELAKRRREWEFRSLQTRRSQTEARIGIFKNVFTGNPILAKGTKNQAVEVAWAVLAHDLWVIARLPRAAPQQARQAA